MFKSCYSYVIHKTTYGVGTQQGSYPYCNRAALPPSSDLQGERVASQVESVAFCGEAMDEHKAHSGE